MGSIKIEGKWEKGKIKEGIYTYEKIKSLEKNSGKKKMKSSKVESESEY